MPTSAQSQEAIHKYVEFGNRLLTFAIVLLALAAVLAMLLDANSRRRRSIRLLALLPILGTVCQAVLGGITVLTGLSPITVSLHFLVSMGIVAGCVALVARSADDGDGPKTFAIRREFRHLSSALIGVTALVVVLGVIVTGSGPHSGDADAELRYSFDPKTVAWLHADVVLLFLGLTIGLVIALRAVNAPRRVKTVAYVVLGIALLQGFIGYLQYWTGLPVVLVTAHVVGACALWVAVLFLPYSQRVRGGSKTAGMGPQQQRETVAPSK